MTTQRSKPTSKGYSNMDSRSNKPTDPSYGSNSRKFTQRRDPDESSEGILLDDVLKSDAKGIYRTDELRTWEERHDDKQFYTNSLRSHDILSWEENNSEKNREYVSPLSPAKTNDPRARDGFRDTDREYISPLSPARTNELRSRDGGRERRTDYIGATRTNETASWEERRNEPQGRHDPQGRNDPQGGSDPLDYARSTRRNDYSPWDRDTNQEYMASLRSEYQRRDARRM